MNYITVCIAITAMLFFSVIGFIVARRYFYNNITSNEVLYKRHAVKMFQPNYKLDEEKIASIVDAARLAPTSYGISAFRIIVVKNKELREKLKEGALYNPQIADSSALLVFATKTDYNENDIEKLGQLITGVDQNLAERANYTVKSLKELRSRLLGLDLNKYFSFLEKQTYIALGFAIYKAAIEGVDSSPMEGFDKELFNKLLSLEKDGYSASVLLALGKEKEGEVKKPKIRIQMSEFSREI